MTRRLRIHLEGGIYHVFARARDGERLFRTPADRKAFLRLLRRTKDDLHWEVLAYVLMDSHYHLLLRTPVPNLSRGMQKLNAGYAVGARDRWNSHGALFSERFGSVLVQDDAHLLTAMRYVVRNPVAAGLCIDPGQWPWTSHHAVVSGRDDDLVDVAVVHELLSQFGGGDGRAAYLQCVLDGDDETLGYAPAGVVYGDSRFVERFRLHERPDAEIRKADWSELRPGLEEIVTDDPASLVVARTVYGYLVREIAEHLGVHRATVTRRIAAAQ